MPEFDEAKLPGRSSQRRDEARPPDGSYDLFRFVMDHTAPVLYKVTVICRRNL